MNVAALDLCKELHELSRWEDTEFHYTFMRWMDKRNGAERTKSRIARNTTFQNYKYPLVPAYDLGYLLRKLPRFVERDGKKWWLSVENCDGHEEPQWMADYVSLPEDRRIEPKQMYFLTGQPDKAELAHADTPENAACKLAIELIKQEVLPRGGDES